MSTEPVSATEAWRARPTIRAPTTTATRVPALPKPRTNGEAMRATPSASSTAPWTGREMRRKAVIPLDMLLVDWPVNCDVGHRDRPRLSCCPDGDEDAARRAAGRAGALGLALARGGLRAGRGGAAGGRSRAGLKAGADGRSRRRRRRGRA